MASPTTNPFVTNEDAVSGEEIPNISSDSSKERFEVDVLPGSKIVKAGSLLDTVLKNLLRSWNWQCHYNQHYLPRLPAHLKELILDYFAQHGPIGSIGRTGFYTLFPNIYTSNHANFQSASISRLNLTGATDHNFLRIKDIFVNKDEDIDTGNTLDSEFPVEDWSYGLDPSVSRMSLKLNFFANLTHLSLARPYGIIDWTDLLGLEFNLAPLTHLSLAYWPAPSLSPKLAVDWPSDFERANSYVQSHLFKNCPSQKISRDIGIILCRLSNATYCLRWLDLTGCGSWIDALGACSNVDEGPQWDGAWRKLEEIVVKEGRKLPKPMGRKESSSHLYIYDEPPEEQKTSGLKQDWLALYAVFTVLSNYLFLTTKLQAAIIDIKDDLSHGARKRIILKGDYHCKAALLSATMDSIYNSHFSQHFTKELYHEYVYCLLGGNIQRLEHPALLVPSIDHYPILRSARDDGNVYQFVRHQCARIDRAVNENPRRNAVYLSPGNWPYSATCESIGQ